jgi:polyisoprenoid-binding protein YceI
MKTVESGLANRDDSLRSAHWFDVDNHPTARFRSTAITIDGTEGIVVGDLTIKGVTRSVVLDVEYLGFTQDPWGNDRAAFSANATINREDWGVTNSMALDNGRLLVSKRIRLEIELELVRQPEPTD